MKRKVDYLNIYMFILSFYVSDWRKEGRERERERDRDRDRDTLLLLLLLPSSLETKPFVFFGLPMWTEDQWLSRNLPGLQYQFGTVQISSLVGTAATSFSVFQNPDSHCLNTQQVVCKLI